MANVRRREGSSLQITHADSGDIINVRFKKIHGDCVDLVITDPTERFEVRRTYDQFEQKEERS